MNRQPEDELRLRLRKLAEGSPQEAGGDTERRLLEAFRARRSSPAQHQVAKYFAAIAASMLVGAALYLFSHAAPSRVPAPKAPAVDESTNNPTAGFVALPYAQSGVPLEQAVVVRVNIPSSRARSFGVPFKPGPSENVSADLLIGQDGVARAVRFVP